MPPVSCAAQLWMGWTLGDSSREASRFRPRFPAWCSFSNRQPKSLLLLSSPASRTPPLKAAMEAHHQHASRDFHSFCRHPLFPIRLLFDLLPQTDALSLRGTARHLRALCDGTAGLHTITVQLATPGAKASVEKRFAEALPLLKKLKSLTRIEVRFSCCPSLRMRISSSDDNVFTGEVSSLTCLFPI